MLLKFNEDGRPLLCLQRIAKQEGKTNGKGNYLWHDDLFCVSHGSVKFWGDTHG
jgi:hypothetical protein